MNIFQEDPNVGHSTRNACSDFGIGFERGWIKRTAKLGQFHSFAYVSVQRLPTSNGNGAAIRPVLKGKLATGESLEVHETTLPPGGMPHPAHHHVHSEMWLIREGTVQLTINGTSHVMGPGSVGFVHSNDEHGIKNVATTPATYFVVAVGPGADAQ